MTDNNGHGSTIKLKICNNVFWFQHHIQTLALMSSLTLVLGLILITAPFLNSWLELQTLFWLELIRCNKVKQLNPQYESNYQIEVEEKDFTIIGSLELAEAGGSFFHTANNPSAHAQTEQTNV